MKIKFSVLHPEETLLGIRFFDYTLCQGIDQEKKMVFKKYIDFSIGFIFVMMTVTFVRKGRVYLE